MPRQSPVRHPRRGHHRNGGWVRGTMVGHRPPFSVFGALLFAGILGFFLVGPPHVLRHLSQQFKDNPLIAGLSATTAQLTLYTEPADGFSPLYNAINNAEHSIDVTMYELVDQDAENALASAAGRGVSVRVLLDRQLEHTENKPAYDYLTAHHVQVAWASNTYPATHQKTVTIDHTTAWVMTANLTSRYYATTRDFLIADHDARDVAAIATTFAEDFDQHPVTPPAGDDLTWSPTTSASTILRLINNAHTSLLVENEEMAYAPVTDALTSAAHRGVSVTVVMTYAPTWASAFTTLAAAGVHLYVDHSEKPLYIHAKTIVADNTTAFIGSQNFSATSLTHNRELGITTTDAAIISHLSGTISNDAAGADPWKKGA